MPSSQPKQSKTDALSHILKITSTKSAKVVVYATAVLGLAALVPGINLPPELAAIAVGVSVESLGILLDRVTNNNISDDEIVDEVEIIINKSGIDKLLTKDDFYHAFSHLLESQRNLSAQNQEIFNIVKNNDALSVSKRPYNERQTISFDSSKLGIIVDIGSISSPNIGIPVAEVRFTLSNTGNMPIKVTSISLNVLKCAISENSLGQIPAGPIDEFFLFAKVTEGTASVELITQHHLLNPSETAGFFLKIDGEEGFVFDFQLQIMWKHLGSALESALSEIFIIEFPARSPEALLKLARHLNRKEGKP